MDNLLDFDEINRLGVLMYYEAESQVDGVSEGKKAWEQADYVADWLLSLLIVSYIGGVKYAGDQLGFSPVTRPDDMRAAIYKKIDGKTFEDRVIDHVLDGDPGAVGRLAVSETHRVAERGSLDGAGQAPRAVNKTWRTMGDQIVRDTHQYLEGMTIPLNDDFYTFDGDHGPGPGSFRLVENNAGCRCILTFRYG